MFLEVSPLQRVRLATGPCAVGGLETLPRDSYRLRADGSEMKLPSIRRDVIHQVLHYGEVTVTNLAEGKVRITYALPSELFTSIPMAYVRCVHRTDQLDRLYTLLEFIRFFARAET